MAVFRAQDLVDDVSIAGQQNQPFGILVQTPDWKNPVLVIHEVDNIASDTLVRGTGDAHGFVECYIDMLALVARSNLAFYFFSIDKNLHPFEPFGPGGGDFAIKGDATLADQFISFTPRTVTGFTDK